MGMTPGFGSLQTVDDLLTKLRHDFGRMQRDPTDQYAAFDFFVTAEHMLDWTLPGLAFKAARETVRQSNILLEITSHIASGSKHFIAEARHHESVSHVDAPPDAFQSSAFSSAFQTGELIVTLDGDAVTQLGHSITALDLAAMVLNVWESRRHPTIP